MNWFVDAGWGAEWCFTKVHEDYSTILIEALEQWLVADWQ